MRIASPRWNVKTQVARPRPLEPQRTYHSCRTASLTRRNLEVHGVAQTAHMVKNIRNGKEKLDSSKITHLLHGVSYAERLASAKTTHLLKAKTYVKRFDSLKTTHLLNGKLYAERFTSSRITHVLSAEIYAPPLQ